LRPNDNQTVIRKLILSLFREIFNWQEFLDRKAFAYTVVTLDESRVLGCLYINPTTQEGFDAFAYMWVRQSEYDQGLDPILFQTVKTWLESSWPFSAVYYYGREGTA